MKVKRDKTQKYTPLEAMQLAIKVAKSGWHKARPNPCVIPLFRLSTLGREGPSLDFRLYAGEGQVPIFV